MMKRRDFIAASLAGSGACAVGLVVGDTQNYMKLFTAFCRDKNIWFAVCSTGVLDNFTIFLLDDATIYESVDGEFPALEFGSKEAYDWIVKEYMEIVKDYGQ